MKKHRGSVKKFFKQWIKKSLIRWGLFHPTHFLNLKKGCLYFSKQTNKWRVYLNKGNMFYIKNHVYIATTLLIVFIRFIKHNFIKNNFFIYSFFVKKSQGFSKNTRCFIEKTIYIILPQHNLKQ